MIERADVAVVERLDDATLPAAADDLAELLRDVTDNGSSVGFLAPLDLAEAKAWWLALTPSLRSGAVLLWVARAAHGRVVGTVQLRPSLMPNSPHRAELAKLMVHTAARGKA